MGRIQMKRKKPHIEQQESIFLCCRAEKDTCEWMPKGKTNNCQTTHASFWLSCCNILFLAIMTIAMPRSVGELPQVFFLDYSSSSCIYGMYSLTSYLTKTRGTLAIRLWFGSNTVGSHGNWPECFSSVRLLPLKLGESSIHCNRSKTERINFC